MEDHTEEDFFDKLVKDEIGSTGSVPSVVGVKELDDARAVSNLSATEVVEAEKGAEDGAVPAPLDAQVDNSVGQESDALIPGNVNESSEMGLGEETALGSTLVKNNVASGTGVKEVQWNLFNTESQFNSDNKFGSYSNFFNELGDNSGDPFANLANVDNLGSESNVRDGGLENQVADLGASNYGQHQEGQHYGVSTEYNVDGQDLSSSQYWEDLYPGWKYDRNTGQWHQVDNYDANANANGNANAHVNLDANVNARLVNDGAVSDQRSDVYYLQQTSPSVIGSVAEGYATGDVWNLNQISPRNVEYPAHMVFDPQYPGWYYDMIVQEWRTLESYTSAMNQSASVDHNHEYQGMNAENHGSQGLGSQDHVASWDVSANNSNQQNMYTSQTQPVAKSGTIGFTEKQQLGNLFSSTGKVNSSVDQLVGFRPSESVSLNEQASRCFDESKGVVGFQSFVPVDNFSQHQNQIKMEPSQHMHFSPSQFDSRGSVKFSQQPLQSGTQVSYAPSQGWSSAGRPPHALITFGFGGKLIVMKDNSSFHSNSAYGSQDSVGGVVSILNLMEVVVDKSNASSFELGTWDYFHTLCQKTFPGPLVGGNVGNKELNKWIDDKIANCASSDMDYRKGQSLRLLFSLLKIGCQYYGKLRSPFGTDPTLKESDCPESAVAKLFASEKRTSKYGALKCCLQNFPSEGQIQATALEVQKLLVSGRKKDALDCALEGQLWGPAIVLASQLGDQFYADAVKQMALRQLVAGSSLRTLCLLIAGQPADVFSNTTTSSTIHSSANLSQDSQQPAQIGSNTMLDEWEENLAIITANRTKDDELVIIHLGDCLWKERGEITAAHICYLVAEANFESYSDNARLCLIGADHWKFPRTYASPEAIQMTELYEYSKVLGNSQFLLLPFQPYKLIYAYMLAEVGKVADSLKYCQAMLKSLKTGRAPEVDTWKQLVSSLEERIRIHQQGGFGTNLAPTKLVGKLLTFFDSTASRVGGGLPPPIPSASHSSVKRHEHANKPGGPRVTNSQSTMAMSSLVPSASMEPISEWAANGNRSTMPNRSVSEPDFGRSPRKVNSSKEAGGSSRFGRFGSQLFQKTVGLVLRSRSDRQAKLGEKNKFYYDEKLKRWVEEGAQLPAEESALPPPPPTTVAFENKMPGHHTKDAPRMESFHTHGVPEIQSPISPEHSSGIPPIPRSSNQFSARGRMGARSRYVDTFNKGGGTPANLFQSPPLPTAKHGVVSNPKFFIPAPAAPTEETVQPTGESIQEAVLTTESNPSASFRNDLICTPQTAVSSSSTLQRVPSMDNIIQQRMGMEESSRSQHSRAASWSGSLGDILSPTTTNEVKPLGEVLGMPPSSYMPVEPPARFSNSGDELHEVEL